jgi:hypothetical protein
LLGEQPTPATTATSPLHQPTPACTSAAGSAGAADPSSAEDVVLSSTETDKVLCKECCYKATISNSIIAGSVTNILSIYFHVNVILTAYVMIKF